MDRSDESVFDEPAHRPAPKTPVGSDDLADEPGLGGDIGPGDPRDAPGLEPALMAAGLPSYGDVYQELRADSTDWDFRNASIVAGGLAFISGVFLLPVVAAASFLWGPLAAVVLLTAPALALVERRPWQVASRAVPIVVVLITTLPVWIVAILLGRIDGMGGVAGVVFATGLTLAATVIGVGVADLWTQAHRDHDPPRVRGIVPHAVAGGVTVLIAMVLAFALLV